MTGSPDATAPRHYRVWHRTRYEYSRPMTDGYTVAYLTPRPTPVQVVEHAAVTVEPAPDERFERTDSFGNHVLQIGLHRPHDELVLHADSEVVVVPPDEPSPGPSCADTARLAHELRGGEALTVRPFLSDSPYVRVDQHRAELETFRDEHLDSAMPVVEAARTLCRTIYEGFTFDPAFTDVSTPMAKVLSARRGVCQDFAHLATAVLRSMGLPARYVSGYLETSPPPGQPRLVGADASHAWCSVWVPEAGWVDFDPTNDLLPVGRHVTVAWGRDYGDVAPAQGVLIGPPTRQRLTVAVDVERIDQPARA